MGSHLIIGLEDGDGNRMYTGFYPGKDSGLNKRGEGPGYVKVRDVVKKGTRVVELPISSDERRSIEKRIGDSKRHHDAGTGYPSKLRGFNCTDWVIEMIIDGIAGTPNDPGLGRPGSPGSLTPPLKGLLWALEAWSVNAFEQP